MEKRKLMFQSSFVRGAPIVVGNVTITPQAQVVTVRSPMGGFVWNRPTSVLVNEGGTIRHIPIIDVTRVLQFAIPIATIALGMALRPRRKPVRRV